MWECSVAVREGTREEKVASLNHIDRVAMRIYTRNILTCNGWALIDF
jgi:hypothetical protein